MKLPSLPKTLGSGLVSKIAWVAIVAIASVAGLSATCRNPWVALVTGLMSFGFALLVICRLVDCVTKLKEWALLDEKNLVDHQKNVKSPAPGAAPPQGDQEGPIPDSPGAPREDAEQEEDDGE